MYLLQPPIRLYESRIWTLQRDSYTEHGPRAWLEGGVPMQVVNNPFIARAYARVIHGLLHDLRARGADDAPVPVVELGSGSGRFGFLLLRALEAERARSPLPARPYKLVMTDLAQANLDSWAAHPRLVPFVERGLLGFARFDAAAPAALPGPALDPNQPVIVLANYLFDTIPSDAFQYTDGALWEKRLKMTLPQAPTEGAPLSAVLAELKCEAELSPIHGGYYGDPHRDAALAGTVEALTLDTAFLFPEGALRVLEHLADRASGLFLLSSDKGNATPASFEATENIEFTLHGEAFSVMVNYDAIGRYVRARGGAFRTDPFNDETLVSAAAALDLGDVPHAMDAFEREFCAFSPLNYQDMVTDLRDKGQASPLSILRLLRLGCHDPEVLVQFMDPLMERAEELDDDQLAELQVAAEATWDNRYDVGGHDHDIAFAAACAFQCARRPEEALRWYQRSLDSCGPHYATHLNMGMCLESLDRLVDALTHAEEALALAPDAQDARELHEGLLEKLSSEAR